MYDDGPRNEGCLIFNGAVEADLAFQIDRLPSSAGQFAERQLAETRHFFDEKRQFVLIKIVENWQKLLKIGKIRKKSAKSPPCLSEATTRRPTVWQTVIFRS
jgi:hypothetical protein